MAGTVVALGATAPLAGVLAPSGMSPPACCRHLVQAAALTSEQRDLLERILSFSDSLESQEAQLFQSLLARNQALNVAQVEALTEFLRAKEAERGATAAAAPENGAEPAPVRQAPPAPPQSSDLPDFLFYPASPPRPL